MVSLPNHDAPAPKRPAWRRTPQERRIADFQRFLIRHRLLVRSVFIAFVLGLVCGSIALGLPHLIERGLVFAKTSLTGRAGLKVQVITVDGVKHLSRTDVVSALRIDKGSSLLDVDVAAARDRVRALGWVKDATILRLPPDRLHVSVTEYVPVILWQSGGKSFAVDDAGHVIAGVDPAPYGALLHVTGQGAAAAAPQLMAWLKAMPDVASRVDFAERVGHRRWNLHLSNQLVVELPDRGLDTALAVLTRLITKENLLNKDLLSLDLRDPNQARATLSRDAAQALASLHGKNKRGL
jgi:cell division protein FtsQ